MYDSILTRRGFLKGTAAAGSLAMLPNVLSAADPNSRWRIAPFRYDVTPPIGHSLAGFGKQAVSVRDPLFALGYVLVGPDRPIVICAVDWIGINNEAHVQWRTALAEGAGTNVDRVAVQCVHQHDAPWACLRAQEIVKAEKDLAPVIDVDFFNACLERGKQAVTEAIKSARPLTHIATSKVKVERIAGNRRLVDASGKFVWRGSANRVATTIALPEGKIDPFLQTIALYSGRDKVVCAHYYATHPMSQYGQGHISADFPGAARQLRQQAEPGCLQMYFTGCAGDVAAGKYNDGSAEARDGLIHRLHAAMVESEAALKPEPLRQVSWKTAAVAGDVYDGMIHGAFRSLVGAKTNSRALRVRPAMQLAWFERVSRGEPLQISALHLNNASLIHLPGEMFVEYQLQAQRMAPQRNVLVAAYGDGAPWYIPTANEYARGGYEIGVAYNGPGMEQRMTEKIRSLLS